MLKKFIQSALLLVVLFTTATTYAQIGQSPEGIQFQALATDANGHPAAGRVIYVKDAIVAKTATGTTVYSETFKVTASSAGIFTIVLGKGTYASGVSSIANIDWANGPFFLNLKIAVEPTIPNAGWNVNNEYVDLGTSQFWSVPFALYSGGVKGLDTKLNITDTAAMLKPYFTSINLKANIESPAFTGTVSGITKSMVGLGNVDNTADINKPVSTATQTALDLKANATDVTTALVLKANTADVNTALDLKVDKVKGKALSTNDYTTAEKTKLAAITGTNTGDQDLSVLAIASNVNTALGLKANTASLAPVATSGNYNDLSNKPSIPAPFNLTTASASVLGGVKIGSNLTIDGNGILSANSSNDASSISGVVPIEKGGTSQTSLPGIKSMLGLLSNNVAIGNEAGTPNQGVNANTIAIGGGAGRGNQGASSIAIGYVSGDQNQGANSISIGGNAAQSGQGTQAVAIGFAAGQNGQGANAVAIGTFAGQSGQSANSIAINATGTGTPLNPANAGFYVDPIRSATATSSLLFYNPTSKELTTASAYGSFVDLTTNQTISGVKTFSNILNISGVSVGPYNGNNNTMVGNNAFLNSTPGANNTAIGSSALSNAIGGNDNTAIGSNAIAGLGSATASGWRNTAVGVSALGNGGGGSDNVAVGFLTLPNTTGGANTAVGMYALLSNTNATDNVAVGAYAQYNTTVGINNTSIGTMSMALNTSGTQNTAIGASAIEKNILGSNNTVLGFSAGKVIADNSTVNSNVNNSVLIGALSKTLAVNSDNEVVIGYNAVGNGSNTVTLGNNSVTNVKTSGTITAGAITYPKVDGSNGQVLTTNGSGVASWAAPSTLYQKTHGDITLSNTVGALITLSLPAGSYLVTYTGMAYQGAGSGSEYVASRISTTNPGNLGGADAIMVSRTVNDGRAYVVHQLGITLVSAGTVSVFANTVYGNYGPTIITGARLTAVQVGAVINQ